MKAGPGRGIHTALNLPLAHQAENDLGETRNLDMFLKSQLEVARDVDPDRIALATPAGMTDPCDYIPKDKADVLRDAESLVLPDHSRFRELEVTPCYKVPLDKEASFRRKMLSSGTAVAIPEVRVARRTDGKLLLQGMFSVWHSAAKDRLFLDRSGCLGPAFRMARC